MMYGQFLIVWLPALSSPVNVLLKRPAVCVCAGVTVCDRLTVTGPDVASLTVAVTGPPGPLKKNTLGVGGSHVTVGGVSSSLNVELTGVSLFPATSLLAA